MSVDVSKIKKGDRVKVSLYGLPESDWLEVVRVDPRHSRVMATLPSGWTRWLYSGDEVTAHEPAAPALPDWLAARVIKDGNGYFGLPADMRSVVFATGAVLDWQEVAEPVTVIVDRDGDDTCDVQAEHDRAVKAEALREAVSDMRRCWQGHWNLPDPQDPESAYSVDRWLEVRADRIEKGADR